MMESSSKAVSAISGLPMMMTSFRLLQPRNAKCPISVTPLPIVTLLRPLHLSNAYASILVTLSGIVTFFNFLQKENAPYPILVTPLPIFKFFRFLHPLNAPPQMSVTLSGIVTLVKFFMPMNTRSIIILTPFGIMTSPPSPLYSSNYPESLILNPSFVSPYETSSLNLRILPFEVL